MTESTTPPSEENHIIAERRAKLAALRAGGIAFPNDFRIDVLADALQREYADREQWTGEALDAQARRVHVAGRIMAKRIMGKASFVTIKDLRTGVERRDTQTVLDGDLDDYVEASLKQGL